MKGEEMKSLVRVFKFKGISILAVLTFVFLSSCSGGAKQTNNTTPAGKNKNQATQQKPQAPAVQGTVIASKDGKISLIMPKGWVKKATSGNTLFQFFAPKADEKFTANVNLNKIAVPGAPEGDPPADVIKDWIDEGVKELSKSMKGYKLVSKGLTNIGGKTGFYIESTFTQNGVPIHMLQYGVYHNKTQYILTTGSLDKTFVNYKKLFQGIANSVTLK